MAEEIAVIADLHMDTEGDGYSTLEETVEEINSTGAKLTVVFGDITGQATAGEEEELDMEEIKEIRSFLDNRLETDTLYIAGNHEQDLGQRFEDILGNELYGSERIGGEKIVYLDSSAPHLSGSRGEITEEQIEFLAEELQKDENFTLFIHHPIHYRDMSHTYWWSEYPERVFCGNKKEINLKLESEKVKAVFNCHVHDYNHTKYEGLHHFTVPPFVSESRKNGFEGSFALIEIGKQVEVEYRTPSEKIDSWKVEG